MKDGAKSTPGPWFVGKRDRAGGRVFANQHGADGVVAGRIENPANARLIAAAPDLLAAAQDAAEIIRDSYGQQDPDIESDCAAVRLLERAIANATKQD